MPDIVDSILSRRSVRQFTDQPIAPAVIHRLLEAAMAAPNACNSQPWEFIVITECEVLDQLRAKLQFARYNATCAVVVCGNPEIANNSAARQYWVQDCSAAMQNLLLAASGLGLGGVWIGVYPYPSNVKPVRELLNMPEPVTPLGIAMLGYPAEGAIPPPRTQYDDHRVHWQVYEPRKPHVKIKNAKNLP